MQEVRVMLLQFRFKNYKSFKEDTIFDMTATTQREHQENLIDKNGNKILPVSVIYGSNAYGKSNFIDALKTMMMLIIVTYDVDQSKKLPIKPYVFSPKDKLGLTEFEVCVNKDDTEYKYGFALSSEKVYEEWFYSRPFKKDSKAQFKLLFERHNNEIEISNDLKKYAEIAKLISDKNLFLSVLGRRNDVDIINDLYQWCLNTNFDFMYREEKFQYILQDIYEKNELFEKIKTEIRAIDSCILDMQIDFSENEYHDKIYNLYTIHKGFDGSEYKFDFELESEGTQKLFILYYRIFNVLNDGGILFVDELDCKIHSLVLENIVKLFNNPEKNKTNAQLVFTAHNLDFLNNKNLRRDQIWFIDKNDNGVSKLYSLADFKDVRSDLDYTKQYLSGRFGAIPYIKEE